jgi:hypothetical protein
VEVGGREELEIDAAVLCHRCSDFIGGRVATRSLGCALPGARGGWSSPDHSPGRPQADRWSWSLARTPGELSLRRRTVAALLGGWNDASGARQGPASARARTDPAVPPLVSHM